MINAVKKLGGSTNPLTSHTHIQNAHGHDAIYAGDRNSPYKQTGGNYVPTTGFSDLDGRGWTNSGTMSSIASNQNTGDNTNHNNWQPFMAVYIWVRTS